VILLHINVNEQDDNARSWYAAPKHHLPCRIVNNGELNVSQLKTYLLLQGYQGRSVLK